MNFIETLSGAWVNLAHVAQVEPFLDGNGRFAGHRLLAPDGESLGRWCGDPAELAVVAIVPSLPGLQALSWCSPWDGDPPEGFVTSQPVLAWRIRGGYWPPEPVCPEDISEPWAIQYPDGSVVIQGERDFANLEAWRAYCAKEHAAEEESNANPTTAHARPGGAEGHGDRPAAPPIDPRR